MSSRPVNQEPEDDDVFSVMARHFQEKEPEELPGPGVNTIIKDFHDLCDRNDMAFAFVLGQTWTMHAICSHGTSANFSDGDYDFVETLLGLYEIVAKQHEQKEL